ncbi:MAG: EcsC family protein [Planctomycetia bacterium]|nr:EcsC family protein [Planctomycetia bacterium]
MDEIRPAGPSVNGRPLTAYESHQIHEIAVWKSRQSSRLAVFITTITSPLTWVVGHFIPRGLVNKVVMSMEVVATKADSAQEVAKCFGVENVGEIANRPLEECDRWARRFSARAERFAIVEGTALSFGGPLVHIPCQLVASLLSVARIGHCYGYPLDRKIDRAIIVDILEIAMLQDPTEREQMVQILHAAIDTHADAIEGEEEMIARNARNIFAEEAVDIIPVVGTAVSFLFDGAFMHSVDETARRIFQERWLRDKGCKELIAGEAIAIRKSSLEEVGLVLGQTLYCTGAIVGFTATFPAAVVKKVVGRKRNPVSAGARQGTDQAVRDAREFITGLRSSYEDNDDFNEFPGATTVPV